MNTLTWYISKLLCKMGRHGPRKLGFLSQYRSDEIRPLLYICRHCYRLWDLR